MKQEKRGHWYLLTGLMIGLGLGLLYAWVISPVQYIDTEPASLAERYKDEYRKVIALAYQANQNIGRARERAALIDADNPARALAAQAQRLLAANLSPREARALAVLASDLGQQQSPAAAASQASPTAPEAAQLLSETPAGEDLLPTATLDLALAIQTATAPLPTATPTVTLTPAPTFTPRPTATPPEVQEAVFILSDNEERCEADAQPGLLQVEVSDSQGNPLPGIRIVVLSQDNEDTFYTGLVPEISLGYADYKMQDGISYAIKVGEASQTIEGIIAKGACGRRLVFSQSR